MGYRNVKKPDRLTNPENVGVVKKMAKFYALQPLDKCAFDMEMKWGVDRLPRIVGVDLAVRYGKAKAELDAAIEADDEVLVAKKSKKMISGWKILDAEAERLGERPIDPKPLASWSTEDSAYCLFKTATDAYAFARSDDGKDIRTYSLDEVARCIGLVEDKFAVLGEAKKQFPGAELKNVDDQRKRKMDEELPF